PTGHQGPTGQHGRSGQQGPYGLVGPGGFAAPGGGGTWHVGCGCGARDWNATPSWNRGPDWRRPAMRPAGPGPGASGHPGYEYRGADGYGENVNGGDYAYVINE